MKKNISSKTDEQIEIIKKAYDKTVENFNNGIEDEDFFPDEFKKSDRYKRLKKTLALHSGGSEAPEIKKYLNPQKDMKFLDVGCAANLVMKHLHTWPSIFYGIDISPRLIKVNQNFVNRNNVKIGGLFVAEVASMPFENDFFDICSVVGVLEYFDINYIKRALKEVHRVLKPNAKMYIDMLNFDHPDCETVIELENYLGRTRKNVPTSEVFEKELKKLFVIDRIESESIMIGYFVRVR